ncbi:MAG TPA: response regulator transcription factor [Clostridia bacterium]|nr:response regulator transcription factor [Clostridia bacterium]
MEYRVLIVEDDANIAAAIKRHLESWGLEAACAEDFRNLLPQFAAFAPHLVLMDISLPFYNGYHWCAEIRKLSKVPVVFVSSASDNMNIVLAMNMGGDDFIAKPFDLSVLSAKVLAMLRRSYDFAGQTGLIEHRGALLNTANGTLRVGEQTVELTRNEYRILLILLENRGAVVGRDALMTRLWETDSFVDENTLAVNVARLRKKLASAGLADYVSTRRGEGYMIV